MIEMASHIGSTRDSASAEWELVLHLVTTAESHSSWITISQTNSNSADAKSRGHDHDTDLFTLQLIIRS